MATKYGTLVAWARRELRAGRFAPGDKFYSENTLCAQHGVSRQTVRQALDLLEREGLLERRRGSGTFVKTPAPPAGQSVGVVSTYFSGYIFPGILTGIEKTLSRHGCGMQLAVTNNRAEDEEKALRRMLEQRVSALIVEPTKSALPNPNRALYQHIHADGPPLVFFNCGYPWADFPVVAMDDAEAGRLAAQCLVDAGHAAIAGIFKSDDLQGHLRYQGYLKCLADAGIPVDSGRVLWYATEEQEALFRYPQRVLAPLAGCTGAVCYNDELAVQLIAFCAQQGIAVPQDLSVAGVDDASISALCAPPLTTVRHPKEALGEAAAAAALTLLQQPGAPVSRLFKPRLVLRRSVVKPGKKRG